MDKNLVLWVEDMIESISEQIEYCKVSGYDVRVVQTAPTLIQELQHNTDRIALIVVDIIVVGIPSLETIEISYSDTCNGAEAGWVILERLLRPVSGIARYSRIPVLLVSYRPLLGKDRERLARVNELCDLNGWAQVKYLEKEGSVSSPGGIQPWRTRFEILINELHQGGWEVSS